MIVVCSWCHSIRVHTAHLTIFVSVCLSFVHSFIILVRLIPEAMKDTRQEMMFIEGT